MSTLTAETTAAGERFAQLALATASIDPPYAVLDLDALERNAADMRRRAGVLPIRIASKSLRVRPVIESLLQHPGFEGVLAYSLPEALWLADTIDDVVLGYPSVNREAIAQLASDEARAQRVTLMVDSVAHLDLIDSIAPPASRPPIRVCIDLDASLRSSIFGTIGVLRSPIHEPTEAFDLAAAIVQRPGFHLVGLMAYEAQIAGLPNNPRNPLRGLIVRALQKMSLMELVERRVASVAAISSLTPLEFVNGGGTGSLEATSTDPSVTELAAGSGFFGPTLFDEYRHFRPEPAALFALPVTRKPSPTVATLGGGGWIASGPTGPSRQPTPVWPEGLRFVGREGAGEVQSPVVGPAAAGLETGDRVLLRHAKAGELSEHVNEFVLVRGGEIIGTADTYRGEGRAF